MVMLSGEHAGVQEDERHDQPEHPLRLADAATLPLHRPVPSEGRSQFYFSVRGTWDRMPAVKIRYLLLKSFHSFLPWCLSDMLS